uniref:Polysaccharide biosynthesis protein n=1 Tax=Rhodopseudomonas palustris (strain BisA53) TaxID=316055 RepID=Q07SM6_RHOP5
MNPAMLNLRSGTSWTLLSFGFGQGLRFLTNVVLTRLLAPELFGIMLIFNALRTGVELLTDLGIGQSLVQNPHAEEVEFRKTAWTLQWIRGVLLWLLASACAIPAAIYYDIPELYAIIPVASLAIPIFGFTSSARFIAQRRLNLRALAIYEIAIGLIGAAGQVALCYFFPTVWSLVFGLLFSTFVGVAGSFFLLPDVKDGFLLSKRYLHQIAHFGKWIAVSSWMFFLAGHIDRLYLAGVIPMALLGVYGISRTISEIMTQLARKFGAMIVFPFFSANAHLPREQLRSLVSKHRNGFVQISALVFGISAATVDLAIRFIFDERYHAAALMTPILIVGAWWTMLCALNTSALLGIGKPRYSAEADAVKLIWLLVGLPLSIKGGIFVCIALIAASDLIRYVYLSFRTAQEKLTFLTQDLTATALMLLSVGAILLGRWLLGLAPALDQMMLSFA